MGEEKKAKARKEINRKAQQEEMNRTEKVKVGELEITGRTADTMTNKRISDCYKKIKSNIRGTTDKGRRAATLTEEEKKKHEKVDFYQFVLNPKSYIQTMENIFDMSFMAGRSDISILYDEESGLPMIGPGVGDLEGDVKVEDDTIVKLEKSISKSKKIEAKVNK